MYSVGTEASGDPKGVSALAVSWSVRLLFGSNNLLNIFLFRFNESLNMSSGGRSTVSIVFKNVHKSLPEWQPYLGMWLL